MIEPGKLSLGGFLIFTLMAFVSCGQSNANQNDNPASAGTNSSGQNATGPARLDRFVGKWGGYAARSTTVSGQVGIDSRWMKVNVTQATPGTVKLEGDLWQTKATLKYDASSERYLLNLDTEGFPQVAALPMSFSEADRFSGGTTTFTGKGKEFKWRATIMDNKGGSEWKVVITQGRDMWSLTMHLGKEK